MASQLTLACLILLLIQPGAAFGAPSAAVVGSPTAAAWLRSAGLECRELTVDQVATTSLDASLIVLPLDQIRSTAALSAITAFAARGGKVLAVYWGTIARPQQQSAYPVYGACALLGVTVAGWALTGPATVEPEPADDGAPGAGTSEANLTADSPAWPGARKLSEAMVIQVEPMPTARVLARLAPMAGGTPMILAVRNGNVVYAAINLFQRAPGSSELQQLFFWLLDKTAPGLVFTHARERAGEAIAAVIRARERLSGQAVPPAPEVRRLLDQAGTAAARARALADGNRFLESASAADQARLLTEQALGMMEGH